MTLIAEKTALARNLEDA